MQVQVTFVEHKPQQMNGQNGPWTLHKFKGSDGQWYEFGKQDAANAAYALFQSQTPLVVDFEQKQNGQYTNNRASAVQAVGEGGAVLAPTVVPSAAPQTAAPSTGAPVTAPATSSAPNYRGESSPNEAGRIARAVAVEHLPAWVSAGIFGAPETPEEIGNLLSFLASYVFKGSRPGQAAAAAPPSDGAGGGNGGAPVEAPAAPAAQAPTVAPAAAPAQAAPLAAAPTADDDIPF